MDDKNLILLVQSQEYLYDKSTVDFRLVHKKQQAWAEIAKVMGQTVDNCMRRWTSLRDRYVKEKRIEKQESPSGSTSQQNKYRWPLKDTLAFLDPHIQTNRTSRRLKYNKEDTNISLPVIVEMSSFANESETDYSPQHSPIERSPLSPTPELEPELELEPEIILTSKKRKRIITDDSTETDKMFSEAVESFKKVCKSREDKERQLEEERPKDQNEILYNFGKMIMATIGSFSVMNQAKAMQQVTNVVMNIKIESQAELQENNTVYISY